MQYGDYKVITSADNERIKFLKKLRQKKYRKEHDCFTVENYAIIHDALASGFDFQALFVVEDFFNKYPEKADFLIKNSQAKEKYLISEKLNKSFSNLDCPSGITAIYARKENPINPNNSALYLNGISDPGNLGTILRTALAFDFLNIIIDGGCADIYNPKTISAAKDAIFKLNIFDDLDSSWLAVNKQEYCIVAADSNQGKAPSSFKPNAKICLVLGSESHGLSPNVADLAQERIKITISSAIESLNVSAAAAILMHEFRQTNI